MPNVNILDAANNLIKAAAVKRDEKRHIQSEADHTHRTIEKQLSDKHSEFRMMTNKATDNKVDAKESAAAAVLAKKLSSDIDDLKKYQSKHTAELKQATDRLEQEALSLENEAKRLQAQA